jgi:hypothetical protein
MAKASTGHGLRQKGFTAGFGDMLYKLTIVLPENWTGGLDGELEGTIIPS